MSGLIGDIQQSEGSRISSTLINYLSIDYIRSFFCNGGLAFTQILAQ